MIKWASPRGWSLVVKLPLMITIIVFGVGISVGAIAVLSEVDRARDELKRNAIQLVRSIAVQNTENVIRLDYWSMYTDFNRQISLMKAPKNSLLFGTLLDRNGTVLTHTNPASHRIGEPFELGADFLRQLRAGGKELVRYAELNGREVLWAGARVNMSGTPLVTALLVFDTSFIAQRIRDGGIRAAIVAAILSIVSGLAGWLISQRMVKPLGDLTKAVDDMRSGDISRIMPIRVGEMDEIGRLTESFNAMAKELKEKANLEEQLRLQEKLAAVGRMVAGVAHEINNPLGGIKTALQNLKLFGTNETKRARELRLLSSGIDQIEHVVQALLMSHQRPRSNEFCDPRTFDDLFLLIRPECEARDIRVSWKNMLNRNVEMPCAAVQQVLMNLLKNAIDAMPMGGDLTFHARDCGDEFQFGIEDTGLGMSQEQLDRIFEPFYTTRRDGVGLGLWMSMQLVDAMGGEIDVRSEVDAGTQFKVIVPVRGVKDKKGNRVHATV